VTEAGGGTNRYAYSGNDPINRLDTSGNGFISKLAGKLFGGQGSRASREAGEAALQKGMDKLRDEGIKAAWRQEVELVKIGRGTVDWSMIEIEELLRFGKVSGYRGHHINNVAAHPELAGLADNIKFMTVPEHKSLHVGNGEYAKPTTGALIDRRGMFRNSTGRIMVKSANARFTYAEVLQNAKSAALSTTQKILDSRTMRVFDLFDPSSMALDAFEREYGYGFFDDAGTRCAKSPSCT